MNVPSGPSGEKSGFAASCLLAFYSYRQLVSGDSGFHLVH
jgi:hypothetical protein